ncbi:MAG: preprotein translocase subunit SecA [Ruminococcaceae bacterium]|nr:preprotein translocase subunit SecA [Oscillospiraceae bacterium]
MGLFSKMFGTYSDRQVKKVEKIANEIENLADKYSSMSDADLKAQTNVLKERLSKGETLDDILPDAFAVVREASTRILGKRHYHVQLIGGIIIHQGRIAEMKTGEGKTLMATLPAYLNALAGKGVHIVTVNEYLARRDSEWMGNIYKFLGLKVGLVVHQMSSADKREAYNADITYGTNSEFGFDYLRDNMVVYKKNMVQRGHNFAIVDEVDSVLIDEARTPLIISGPSDDSSPMYEKADAFVRGLKVLRIKEIDAKESQEEVEEDYIVDEKARTAVLTTNGVKKAEKYFGVDNLGDIENNDIMHYINNAIRARGVMKNEVDYIVKDDQVLIVDSFTGRIMHGRRYSNGLHQAIEAKEGVKVEKENKTQATITYQNFFRLYTKLSGMTGTALTEENEFREIYALDVVEIPTNKPMIRKDLNDVVYTTVKGKYAAIVEQIKECHEKGQPVLVGTVSIDKSELLSKILTKNGIKHNVLNAKYHDKEAEIIAQAGKFGAVTISTNMAGRGTDIMLGGNAEFLAKKKLREEGYDEAMIYEATSFGETDNQSILEAREKFKSYNDAFQNEISAEAQKVRDAGGLFILGTERHESRRIDNQLRGRAGRQGDPGESRFFISLEDDLMRLFGGDRLTGIVSRLNIPESQAIDAKLVSNSIETAQKRLEGTNFERRKHVLEYDDVMNQQREIIYGQRRSVLDDSDMTEKIVNMIHETIISALDDFASSEIPDEWNFEGLKAHFRGVITTDDDFNYSYDELNSLTREKLEKELISRADKKFEEQEILFTPEIFKEVQRAILLRAVDKHWVDHIDEMDDLISGINLHAFAQRSPINEYKIQGADMFDAMISSIREDTVRMVLTAKPAQRVERKQVMNAANAGLKGQAPEKKTVVKKVVKKASPNDPCPCGSGKKFKKCCGSVVGKTEE